jgi:NAD-dependent dihydropyrimidine dehydrogenase PreA subunit
MDRDRIRKETGFNVRFGPVRAKHIPDYLAAGMEKTEEMKRADFGLAHRVDMLVSMNFIIWAPVALLFAIFWPHQLVHLSALYWGIVVFLYIFFPWVPGSGGWRKSLAIAVLLVVGYLAAGYFTGDGLFADWPWMAGGTALAFAVGFDVAGIVGPKRSDAETLIQKLGFRRFGFLFSQRMLGKIAYDRGKCTGCLTCHEICPVGVYDPDAANKKTILARPDDCFSCGACVQQCPEGALSLTLPD